MKWSADKIEQWDINKFIPYARNARTHSDEQIAQIAASINEFGFTNPILAVSDGVILAGHGRYAAAQRLGLKKVPVVVLDHLSETQRRALVIADNRIAENAGWDSAMLALEIEDLKLADFDLDLLGFNEDELELLMAEPDAIPNENDEDEVPEPPDDPVTVRGDIWLLGRHRLMCGDSISIDEVDRLLNGGAVDMIMTDPPYGISAVKVNGKVGGGSMVGGAKPFGKVGGGKIVPANIYAPIEGDDSIDVALEAIQVINTLNAKAVIIWGGNYYANALPNSSCWIVWDKQNEGNFADCELAWTNQKSAARIFAHMWNGMIKASERGEKRVHPTQKPVALFEWCLTEYGDSCEVVLDLFGGSGSSLIACEQMSREARVMEISPHYCDVIIKRWQNKTGEIATLEATGEAFPG